MRLEGKVAIITGASSGIGKATALLFGREGAKVIVNYSHSVDEANEVVDSILKSGGEAIAIKADVSKEHEVKAMMEETIKKYGKIDILYNNAGVELQKPITITSEEEWNKVLDINLKGMFHCSKHIISYMKEGGVIVNTASVAGLFGSVNLSAYCASKGGVIALTKALALEYAPNKIRVNCICPGAIDTPMLRRFIDASPDPKATEKQFTSMHPLGRLGQPEDIARAALFLASDSSSFITGHSLVVDGGFTAQ
ncbi:MAG: SDR family oxidoreductase [DPANN group archaeon]|nr:SDR family oxidoreductase [DPANN group archaeon]